MVYRKVFYSRVAEGLGSPHFLTQSLFLRLLSEEDLFTLYSSLKEWSAICIIIAMASLACARKANASCMSEAF